MAVCVGAGEILAFVEHSRLLRLLPLASTTLLLRAMCAMRRFDEPVLRFGHHVPSLDAMAEILEVPKDEFHQLLPGLISLDLLALTEDGVLYSPPLSALAEKLCERVERLAAAEKATAARRRAGKKPEGGPL